MKDDRRLKFSHNYFSPEDTTIANRDSRLQIVSGMRDKYTRVVIDRVNHLLSAGIWDLWLEVRMWREKSLKVDRYTMPDFAALTLQHDGVHLLFLVLVALFGLGLVAFIAPLVPLLARELWQWKFPVAVEVYTYAIESETQE